MDRDIVVSGHRRLAHGLFAGWLKGLLNNYVNGFWDEAVTSLLGASFLKRSRIFFQEMYGENGDEFRGFFVVIPVLTDRWLLLFNKDGVPINWAKNGVSDVFNVTENGDLEGVWMEGEVALQGGLRVLKYRENWFGINFVVVYVKASNGEVLMKGLVDVRYEGRESGTYRCDFWPEADVSKFLVQNITTGLLKLVVPISDGKYVEYEVGGGGAVVIPVTVWSREYLEGLNRIGSIRYRTI